MIICSLSFSSGYKINYEIPLAPKQNIQQQYSKWLGAS